VYTGHVRCSKEERPPELISLGNSLRPLRYNSPDCPVYTGLSCVTAGQRLFRRQQLPATHLMRALRAQTSGVPILTHRTMNRICPVCTGLSGAPSNRQPHQTASLVVGAINTPNHPPFIASKFSASNHYTRASIHCKAHQKRSNPLPTPHKALVTRESDL
jgi:hypothetical protein